MRRLVLFVVAGLLAIPAAAASHIRVVLDLSQSMRTRDPGRLAILSTELLYDLARPKPGMGDTFEVLPFDVAWEWRNAGDPPPVATRPPIKVRNRPELIQALSTLGYDAQKTYFYPGIEAALESLEHVHGTEYDVRTIVLLTDGVPELLTRDAELQRLQRDLAPRLEASRIRLYILAFGPDADHNRDFFDAVLRGQHGSLGEYFVDPQGTKLLDYMLQLFSRSFGFTPDMAHRVPATSSLDLDTSVKPDRVAVAVLSNQARQPALALTPPATGGSVNNPEGVQGSISAGGSYALRWVLAPNPGAYGFQSDAGNGTVAVLRPTRLVLKIVPESKQKQTAHALASFALPMRVVVSTASGAQGDPGPVDLSYRTCGQRTMAAPPEDYDWCDDLKAPAPGPGTATPQGRVYTITPTFRENAKEPSETYRGYIEVIARRGEAVVASLVQTRAHPVEVHPYFSIAPLPAIAYVSTRALRRRQSACTQFSFQLTAGQLPHPDQPKYPLRVLLKMPDPAVEEREFRQAQFTLDGQPLEVEGKAAAPPGKWYSGRTLPAGELLGNHKLCVQIGRPAGGDPAHPVMLTVAATLLDSPYDDFGVVQAFVAKVPVAPPSFVDTWRGLLIAGAILAALLSLLWYSRDRPAFPPDLRYAIGREDSSAGLTACALEERSPLAQLLGWVGQSPIIPPGQDRALAAVRPASEALFQVRPSRNVRLEEVANEEAVPMRHGLATVSVHRNYRLRGPNGSYLFRMEYE